MILIVGGSFQGKKEYAKSLFSLEKKDMIDGAVCPLEDIYTCKCIYHFHEWVKRILEGEKDLSNMAERLQKENPKIIIISNELGYGVVPIQAFDREYRETTGRVCTKIAGAASQVHRVICGIGTVIKHG